MDSEANVWFSDIDQRVADCHGRALCDRDDPPKSVVLRLGAPLIKLILAQFDYNKGSNKKGMAPSFNGFSSFVF